MHSHLRVLMEATSTMIPVILLTKDRASVIYPRFHQMKVTCSVFYAYMFYAYEVGEGQT